MNFKENTTWNFISRILYAFQVIIIAIAIPLLSYMEMTHAEKPENASTKNSSISTTEKSDVVVLSVSN